MTHLQMVEQGALEALKDAARKYAQITEAGASAPLEALHAGARLRLSAKAFLAAERRVREVP